MKNKLNMESLIARVGIIMLILLSTGCKQEIKPIALSQKYTSLDAAIITVNVKNYGAKGDGKTNDVSAFQKAEDYLASIGGGILYVPKGVYIVSEPFYHRNFVTLQGDGDNSIIKNAIKTKGGGAERFCIYIGNFSPSTYADCVHYDVNDIAAGSNQVTLQSTAPFFVGQTVLIDSKAGFMSDDGHWKPYAAFINRVVSIENGVITLEDAVIISITGAQIAPTNKFTSGKDTNKIYICQQPVIKNIRFESNGDWTMRFGVYKGLFENISLKTTDVIPGNGLAYCTFKNIRAVFSQKVIEMAMYSHNSTVDSLTATWWDGFGDPDIKPLLKMGENMRNCSFSNLNINSGAGKNFGMAIRFEHAYNNKITNSTFNCQTVSQNGIELTTADAEAFVQGNEVSGNTFVFGNTDTYMRLKNETNSINMSGNKITGNTFSGKVRKKYMLWIGSVENNILEPNIFK